MTVGEMMFYGGIALFAVTIISFVIVKIVLASKGKKLKALLSKKYDI